MLTIAQISDTHLSPTRPVFHDNFALVAEHLRTTRPDLIINTGDLALDAADSDDDMAEARRLHADLPGDVLVLPGNHDVGDHADVGTRQVVNAERMARWDRAFGPAVFDVETEGWRLVGLNALTLGTGAHDDPAQIELLAKAAKDLGGRRLAVFLHKPLCDEAHDETLVSSRFMTPGPRAAVLAALGPVRPAFVACGHVHQYRDTLIGGVRHIWAPAVSFMISDPWQPVFGAKTVGYLEHRLHSDGRFEHRLVGVRGLAHHDLASLPDLYGDPRRWGPGGA